MSLVKVLKFICGFCNSTYKNNLKKTAVSVYNMYINQKKTSFTNLYIFSHTVT